MDTLTDRNLEDYTKKLRNERDPEQILSVIRWSGEVGAEPTGSYIVTISQASPEEPAKLSATWSELHTVNSKQVPLAEAINSEELQWFQDQFRALPNTPANLKFCEEAVR